MEWQEIMDNFSEGFCRWTPENRVLAANAFFLRLMEFNAPIPTDGFPNHAEYPCAFSEMGDAVMRQLERKETAENFEYPLERQDGGLTWLSINARRVTDDQENTIYYDAWTKDISKRKLSEADLEHQAFYDPLTELPNRRLFNERLAMVLRLTKRSPNIKCALLCVDMRLLKNVNLHYGRAFGDMLLRHVAAILRSSCRENDLIARIASDTFAVLLYDVGSGVQIIKVIKRIRAEFSRPLSTWGQRMDSITADIGVVFPINNYQYPEDILRDSEVAVHKASGSNNNLAARFFSKRMLEESSERVSLSVVIQSKTDMDGFYLDYQPIVRANGGALHAFEALARWTHNGRKVNPSVFIPIIENSRFIRKFGVFVIEEACSRLRRWQREYGSPVELHVNISPQQLLMPVFPEKVRDILERTGVDASRLLFEVTESAFLHNFEKVLFNINAVRNFGIRFCLDDFGTGYSSLSYLMSLPINCLKIDRSFVTGLEGSDKARVLLQHILSIGRDMGYSIVVEGVEKESQLAMLGDLSELQIQGYYFHKPLPAESAGSLLESGREIGAPV